MRAAMIVLLFALGAVGVWSVTPVAAQPRAAGVSTDFVERREVSETVPVFAQVVGSRDSNVAARVAGVVDAVTAEVGDRVAAGAILAELETELLSIDLQRAEAAMEEARAGIEVAEAGLLLAEQSFNRVAGLRDTTAFSQGTFEDRQGALAQAGGALAQAEARVLTARSDLARADYNLERAVIRAPFPAVVLEVDIDAGEYIQLGQTVMRLLDITALEVEASVPARFVGNLEEGMELGGATSEGAPLRLTVRAILPTEQTTTRTRPVRFSADLDATGGPVALGQSLTVDVPVTTARAALLVPKDAVAQSQGAWQAFVHEDGKAVPRRVEIGASFGDAFEVLSGLAPGDEVVVRGNERLRPMQDIAPNPVRPAPNQSDSPAAQTDTVPTDETQEGVAPTDTAADGLRQQAAVTD